jgi:hypothetical protein
MTYLYGAGELREPGTGLDVFQTAKRTAAKEVINGAECYDSAKMQAMGATPADIFDATFVDKVGYQCATNPFGPDCSDPLAVKWKARWIEDRPKIDAMSSAPILIMYGGADTFVSPSRAQCARNKLAADLGAVTNPTTTIQYCFNSKVTHRSIVRSSSVDYLAQWIAAKAGAGADPGTCSAFPTSETCSTPPHEY